MAKSQIRFLFRGIAAARRLSTAPPAAKEPPPPHPALPPAAASKDEGKPLYRRLSALGGAPRGSVARTMNKWVGEGRPARAVRLMKCVKELRKYKRYDHALELMDWMVKTRGMNMSYSNHAIRLDLISKVRGIESAEEYFCRLPEPAKNQQTYGSLLSCYCSAKMEDKATKLYQKMNELNMASSTLVHNNLMSLYMKLGQHEKVANQLQEMKAKNIALDSFTCCILMTSYASSNDIESVDGIIKEMEEGDGVTLGWSAYSTLAAIYISAGLFAKAESALKKLEKVVGTSDQEPYHFLISLYARTRNLEEVKRVWKSLKGNFTKLTNTSYLAILQALNKLGDHEGMKHIYEEWESNYISYNVMLTNLMVEAYLRCGMTEEAECVWERASEKGARFDLRTCELYMNHFLENRRVSLALEWLEKVPTLVKQGEWKLDPEKVNEFLVCFQEDKDVDGAEMFCKCLKKLCCLDLKAYQSLLKTYSIAGKTNPFLRRRMEKHGIEIDSETEKLLEVACQ